MIVVGENERKNCVVSPLVSISKILLYTNNIRTVGRRDVVLFGSVLAGCL
jgi:hypothetical protein